ncbi:lysylphosphatidylglycerol synthetase-like protein (DUF2156 family) [Sinomonas atrocyanea]|uniref:bifunctional lysylphosphatidylglycerol flippase/synthetase MprF n=1 Tax=Sinomonas atrocyanea TaxID=37927 RepID=UPI002783FCD2|nr:DUF2156 domain-containing protein [Sinomonas atrocyanea]MDQ0258602.1 lysylphosphatidylglycerol synthetase-like protein (DUF2156 family) [Sinomonas atrocyanea]
MRRSLPLPLSRLGSALRGAPVTVLLTAVFLAAGGARALGWVDAHGIAVTPHSFPDRWWAVLASALWPQTVPVVLLGAVLLLAAGALAERRLGPRRFAAAALGTHVAAVLAGAALAHGLRAAGGAWSSQLLRHSFAGPSAMALGALMAATAGMGPLWRRRIRLAVLVLTALLLLYGGSLADLIRFLAAVAGLVLGPALHRRRPRLWPAAVSRRESRTLIAVAVGAAAVGPVIAGMQPHAAGPLAVLHLVFTGLQPVDPDAVQALCSDPAAARRCAAALLQQRAGAGAVFMAVLPTVLLLLLAEGIRRGRRAAWAVALAVECALAAVAVVDIVAALAPAGSGSAAAQGLGAVHVGTFRNKLALVLPLLTPAALAGLLVATRAQFAVRAPRGTYRRLAARLAGTAAALALLYVGAGLALASDFSDPPRPLDLLADLPDRFLPLGYLTDTPPAFVPETLPATVLYEGVGILFWATAGALALGTFLRSAVRAPAGDRERAALLLAAAGGTCSLQWMTTWAGNRYWFTSDGTGYIAYRPYAGVALALGPPVCPAGKEQEELAAFAVYAAANGWTPCLYAVPEHTRGTAAALGWATVQIAEDAVLDLDALDFTGRRHQNTRTALNRAHREGIRAHWTTYADATPDEREQIEAISAAWIAEKGLPEMGFTLGGAEEMKDPAVRLLLALDAAGTVHAVSSWLPIHAGGTVTGWTLDLMRRRSTGFRPAIEFLIASAALDLKEQGFHTLSLSGAPLARSGTVPAPGSALDGVLRWLGSLLEPAYGFRTLHAFKARFHPRWEALHLAYPDPAALPAIATALTHAYLPHPSPAQQLGLARRLAAGLLRRPAAPGLSRRPRGA